VASLFRRKNLLSSISSSSINPGRLSLGVLTFPNFEHTWAPSFVMSGHNHSTDTSAAGGSNIFATASVVYSLSHHPHSSTGRISTAELEHLESVYQTNHANSAIGDQSHTSHPVWLSLCHVTNLFGVPGTAAKGSKTSSAAPACRIVSFLGSDIAGSSGSRLHATALKAEEAVRWEKEAREEHSRANDFRIGWTLPLSTSSNCKWQRAMLQFSV